MRVCIYETKIGLYVQLLRSLQHWDGFSLFDLLSDGRLRNYILQLDDLPAINFEWNSSTHACYAPVNDHFLLQLELRKAGKQ